MTRVRPVTLHVHAALEFALGTVLIVLPFAFQMRPAAIIVGVAAGAVLAGIALAGSEPGSRGGLPLSAHAAYDSILATLLACIAIVLAIASGGHGAVILFLAAAAAELALSMSTSYRARRI